MEVRAIDLREELEQLRKRGLPCTETVAASTDTLTPPSPRRRVAALCGGDYRELDVPGGATSGSCAPTTCSRASFRPAAAESKRSRRTALSSGFQICTESRDPTASTISPGMVMHSGRGDGAGSLALTNPELVFLTAQGEQMFEVGRRS